ncbi:MAG: hypothetical protein R3B69_03730 [Candidatus Paceibacterota bacterium]
MESKLANDLEALSNQLNPVTQAQAAISVSIKPGVTTVPDTPVNRAKVASLRDFELSVMEALGDDFDDAEFDAAMDSIEDAREAAFGADARAGVGVSVEGQNTAGTGVGNSGQSAPFLRTGENSSAGSSVSGALQQGTVLETVLPDKAGVSPDSNNPSGAANKDGTNPNPGQSTQNGSLSSHWQH